MKILYCGDSAVGGAANYLLGVLADMKAAVTHVPPSRTLDAAKASRRWDLVILSDYPAAQARGVDRVLADSIRSHGAGLLMLGGWASYSGPFGGWRGTRVESLLPVTCLAGDDRTNFPGGATMLPAVGMPGSSKATRAMRVAAGQPSSGAKAEARGIRADALPPQRAILGGLSFRSPAAICGFNALRPRPDAVVLLEARPIRIKGTPADPRLRFCRKSHPLLVVRDGTPRAAAFATDLAPHWCAGLVDWGGAHRRLAVANGHAVEVGRDYIRFVRQLVEWTAGRR